jgi:hypothetical protein
MSKMMKKQNIILAQHLQIYANSKEASMVRKTQGRQFGLDRLHGSTK